MSIFEQAILPHSYSHEHRLASLRFLHLCDFLKQYDSMSYIKSTHTVEWLCGEVQSFLQENLNHFQVIRLPIITLHHTNDQWMAMSAFQKAIRRGDFSHAIKAVMAMFYSGLSVKAWKRLGVIAMEDIGLANPPLMALVLYLMKNKTVRKPYDEEKLLHYIVSLMCYSPKSRDLCDVVVWGLLEKETIGPYIEKYRTVQEQVLMQAAQNTDLPFKERFAAFWLAHPARFRMQEYARPSLGDKQLYLTITEEMRLPVVLGLCLNMGMTHVHEALSYPIPFVWELMQPDFHQGSDFFPEPQSSMIGNVYAATYDKHVRSGKRAMKLFLEKSSASPLLSSLGIEGKADQFKALERAVFYVEGSILKPKLHYPKANALYFDVLEAKIKHNGFKSLEDALMFYQFVKAQLHILNDIRTEEVEQNLSLFGWVL